MSRKSDSKKARRRKRQAARDANWIPAPAGEADEVTQAVGVVDAWITGRGWVLDDNDSDDDVISWYYPPSAAEPGDGDLQPVTRMWIAIDEDDAAVALEFGAVLVGSADDDDDGVYLLDPETLVHDITALEDYRPGDPRPELG